MRKSSNGKSNDVFYIVYNTKKKSEERHTKKKPNIQKPGFQNRR